jgi:hypothetical protein
MTNIVLIDDTQEQLTELLQALRVLLSPEQVEVRTWNPTAGDKSPKQAFDDIVDTNTVLVVTDYDLTSRAQTGLFGTTIVSWCQTLLIPVGDFSRGNRDALPKEPDQYGIRVPTGSGAADFIAGVYQGFSWLRLALSGQHDLLRKKRSPVGVLAQILGRPTEESRFALYGAQLGTSNAALMQKMAGSENLEKPEPSDENKVKLLTYVLGHLLLNVILRFPGPILNSSALAAYLAINVTEVDKVEALFERSRYTGPFNGIEKFFWLSSVDDVLDELNTSMLPGAEAETQGELNRQAIEGKLGMVLERPQCKRCNGKNGGFLCPFTKKTVCERPDCSVGSSGWIPAGARLSRIEKEFYDEWAPILGF